MNNIIASSSALAFALYAVAAMLLPQERSRNRSLGIAAISLAALLLHILAISQSDSAYWLAAIGGAVLAGIAIIIAIANGHSRLPTTGFSIAAATLVALFTPQDANTIGTHLLLVYVACGFFALAAIQAISMAIQEQQLRARRPAWVLRWLAPLNDMEKLLFEQITLGFFILSLGLVAGMASQYQLLGNPLIIRKLALSLLVWLTFGTLLWGRWYRGWRAQTAVLWTLGGCTMLGIAYVVSHLATSSGNLQGSHIAIYSIFC